MNHTAASPKPRPGRDPRGAALLGALLAVPLLVSTPPAAAEKERGMASQASGQAQSAPAPAPSAPSYSPPSTPSYQPAPARSSPSSSPPSSSPSASAPSRGSSGGGSGVTRSGSRGGGHDGSTATRRGYSDGRGVVSVSPRGSFHPRPYRSPRRHYYPPHRWGTSWTWGGPWDWWRWGGSWGPYWGWGWGWGGVVVIDDGEPYSDRYARVDTDVRPEAAEVYLDGTYIGSADDFDGFPDYLYLEPGKYRIEFRHPSYETVVRELEVRRGQQLRFNDEMKLLPGKDRMGDFDPERRGTPLGRVFGKPEPERPGRDRTGRFEVKPRPDATDDEDLDEIEELDETDADDEDEAVEARPAPPAPPREKAGAAVEAEEVAPAERGRFRFEVEPDDAAVYLDDRYVGTGEELAGLRRGYPVSPGKHAVTVVRPGYATRTLEVEAKAGSAIDVVVELEKK